MFLDLRKKMSFNVAVRRTALQRKARKGRLAAYRNSSLPFALRWSVVVQRFLY